MIKRLAVFAALLLATGCSPEVMVKIYVSDALDVLDGDPIDTPIELAIPALGRDNCVEDAKQIAKILANFVKNPEFKQCSTREMFTYGIYTATVPMISFKTLEDLDTQKAAYTVALHRKDCSDSSCDRVGIGLLSKVTQKDIMRQFSRLSGAMFFEGKSDPLVINFQIENDTREKVRAVADHGFLNGRPSFADIDSTASEVARRESVELRLSDAGAANLALGNDAVAGYIYLDKR